MSGTRPRTLPDLRDCLSRFMSDASLRAAQAFVPRPDDIFIAPYSKCGTTWMQQIVHGLRSGGSMDFEEISQVVPWIEMAHDLGSAPDAPQVAQPRAFKSHLAWDAIPKGGRYITVLRDPRDAMLSLYRFFDGWLMERGAIPLAKFAAYYLTRPDDNCYWQHAASWWARRGDDNVLLFCFEDMKRDLPGTVAAVADFIGVADPGVRQIAARQATFEFMKAHGRQFDDHLLRENRDPVLGLPPGAQATKVHHGQAGQGRRSIPPQIEEEFARKWQAVMGARFGLADYAALRAALGA